VSDNYGALGPTWIDLITILIHLNEMEVGSSDSASANLD
jgi:hypothetical protein